MTPPDTLDGDLADYRTWAAHDGPRTVDLFAGPGGWDRALAESWPERHAGTLGVEYDEAACETRRAAGHLTLRADVAALDPTTFRPLDGLIASPPCQAYSQAGKRAGVAAVDRLLAHVYACRDRWYDPPDDLCTDDLRADLTLEPLRWAHATRPRWVLLEQVPEVLPLWQATAHVLDGLGYQTWTGRLLAADYGVPQTRRRAILIARADGPAAPPPTTHYDGRRGVSLLEDLDGSRPWITMAAALGWDDPTVEITTHSMGRPGDRSTPRTLDDPAPTVMFGHAAGEWTWRRPTSIVSAGVTGEGRPKGLDSPADTITGKGTAYWIHDRPATTVQGDPRIGRPGHKDRAGGESQFGVDSVRVTVEEAGILQSFPADYPWRGSSTARYQQVGNAIPPGLASAILQTVLEVDRA